MFDIYQEKFIGKLDKIQRNDPNSDYKGLRECGDLGLGSPTSVFNQALKDARRQSIKKEREERFHKKAECLFRHCNVDLSNIDNTELSYHGRFIGNNLYDFPFKFSGYESKESLERRKKEKNYKPTDEHFYPRQLAGEIIVVHIMENQYIEFGDFVDYINVFRQVHKVTPEENRKLMYSGQKVDEFISPEKCYENAGIELVSTMENMEDITRVEDVAPTNVLTKVFGHRFEFQHKY